MASRVQQLFEALAGRLDREQAAKIERTIQWKITDEDPGVWAFKIDNGSGDLISGGVDNPDATFVTDSETWIGVAEGTLDPMRQFMSGKLKVEGDMMLALRVPKFFPVGAVSNG
ncbi:SCP2 sterol-binding domain-containing protein [Naumannella halotolerans]|uniref:SCP-2 sterol transfer family protein n=1 Tax=Naumannella halotolerans TaxID=993414 RepID=A0A4R7IZ53_9ACTN|nr:SCP2 sterol-binding domain-containing protein [Naumannella halotolerans]TDT30082.1 SCP-2 sterol transfer family protein [Naumannella halotolerans]